MSKKKKNKLLLNLIQGEKHKHKVAMVNEEAALSQHEPNSNMARMFVVMLLIHVVVIGGIIIYDWINGDEAQSTTLAQDFTASSSSALPAPAVNAAILEKQMPIEEYATYSWTSGDSIESVAAKLKVTKETLIRLNMLDKGAQLDQGSILRYPRQPVVRAQPISVAGANGELAQLPPPVVSLSAAQEGMSLTAPGESGFSFSPTIEKELTPAPIITPNTPLQDTPPPSVTKDASGLPAQEAPKQAEKSVPKAIPVPRPPPTLAQAEKILVKKAIPTKKTAPAQRSATTYTVKPNETLYSIATKHHISVKALQESNRITRPELLRDGMQLVIPSK